MSAVVLALEESAVLVGPADARNTTVAIQFWLGYVEELSVASAK